VNRRLSLPAPKRQSRSDDVRSLLSVRSAAVAAAIADIKVSFIVVTLSIYRSQKKLRFFPCFRSSSGVGNLMVFRTFLRSMMYAGIDKVEIALRRYLIQSHAPPNKSPSPPY